MLTSIKNFISKDLYEKLNPNTKVRKARTALSSSHIPKFCSAIAALSGVMAKELSPAHYFDVSEA